MGLITDTLTAETSLNLGGSDLQTTLNAKAPINNPTFTGTVSGITASMVGLSNVTNVVPLAASNNLSDLVSTSTARTNLGLGTLATQSGTFSGTSSGTNTGDQTSVSGNAGTATTLQTARNINGVSFDGSTNITIVDITTTTKGDIMTYSTAAARLPVGTNGQSLTALSTETTGLKWVTPATYQASPVNPGTTTSTTGVMMGLAGTITPTKSGTIMIIISGDYDNATGDTGCSARMYTGTGTAPTNGAAITGTARGGLVTMSVVASSGAATNRIPFSLNCLITGLTVGTAYWIDIALATITGGTARARNISISSIEI